MQSLIKHLKPFQKEFQNIIQLNLGIATLDPKIVDVVDSWTLFRDDLCNKNSNWDLKKVVVIDRWSLFEVVVSSDLIHCFCDFSKNDFKIDVFEFDFK
jgi:hypothetical protein